MKKLWFVIIPLVVAAGVFLYLRDKNANGSQETALETAAVQRGKIEVKVLATGIVEPYTRVEVSSPVNGRIDKVLVKEGDKVKEGDVLAWISSEDRIALLDAARSALESAEEAKDAEADREAKADYEIADKAYRPVPLTNSIRGEVISRTCEPGQNVSTQTALFAISDRLVATVKVDEADIGKIKRGQAAWVVLDAFPDERVKGRVTKISREGKLVSDVVEYDVMVEPLSVPKHWASGMTANVEFVIEEKDNILVVSKSAITERDGASFVTLMAGERPRHRRIETGMTDGRLVEVVRGLEQGDRVVLSQTAPSESETENRGPRMRMMMGPH